METLAWTRETVTAQTTGEEEPALVAQCLGCDGRTFYVYLIGDDHLAHMQCATCDVTSCSGHVCDEDD